MHALQNKIISYKYLWKHFSSVLLIIHVFIITPCIVLFMCWDPASSPAVLLAHTHLIRGCKLPPGIPAAPTASLQSAAGVTKDLIVSLTDENVCQNYCTTRFSIIYIEPNQPNMPNRAVSGPEHWSAHMFLIRAQEKQNNQSLCYRRSSGRG